MEGEAGVRKLTFPESRILPDSLPKTFSRPTAARGIIPMKTHSTRTRRDNKSGRPSGLQALCLWASFSVFGVCLSPVPAGAEPIVYWSFDDDFSVTSGDPRYNGIAVNGTTIDQSESRFGRGSARFDRAAEQSIHIPNSPFTQGSYTYAAWYRLGIDSIEGGDRYFVLEASDGSTWPASFGLRRIDGEQVGQVFAHDDGTVPSGTPNTGFPAGPHREWRHIAVTYDAVTLRLKAYLDGEAIAVLPLRDDATALSPSTTMNLGAHRNPSGRNWEGWIDEAAVWDRVLNHREIELLQIVPPNLIGHFRNADYAAWIAGFEIPAARRLPAVDAGGNGITNLESFAFGLDPTGTARGNGPEITGTDTDRDGPYVGLSLNRNPHAHGIEITFEISSDLVEWTPAEGTVVEETPEQVEFRIAIPD